MKYQTWLHERDRDRDHYDGHPDRNGREIEEWAHAHNLPYFDEQVRALVCEIFTALYFAANPKQLDYIIQLRRKLPLRI